MKRLIVISDTHGNSNAVADLLPRIAENDCVIHLGDGAGDMRETRALYPDKVYVVGGNCDFLTLLPKEGELEIEQVKIFYCHGHKYGVKDGRERLAAEAKSRGCNVALYGHTHIAMIDEIDGVTLINPGSLRYPVGKGGSYCYLVINKDKITPVIVGDSYF